MSQHFNLIILFMTIFGASYFLLFEPDSDLAATLMTLAPLGWVAFFSIRFLKEWKNKKEEKKKTPKRDKTKVFKDPEDYLPNSQETSKEISQEK
ncbi:MAG: hypothetical protein CME63_08190 [Halobacteriovoraceae bacterium]|nr:hypothetical protein [Halobacteriovoraceae bacterium]